MLQLILLLFGVVISHYRVLMQLKLNLAPYQYALILVPKVLVNEEDRYGVVTQAGVMQSYPDGV